MWGFLEKLSEQVNKYATFFGQLWYVLVFVFRAIVVMSLGGAVYGDEQGAFQCSTKIVGCTQKCYNDFAKISHMRFWAFQLIAVVAPTVFFHFYSSYVLGEIQKLKTAEENVKKIEEGGEDVYLTLDAKAEKDIRKMSRRQKKVGNVKTKKIMDGHELKEIPYTSKIHWVYFLTVVARIIIEGIFIWLAFLLFRYMVVDCEKEYGPQSWCETSNPMSYLWMEVPPIYECRDMEVCTQHVNEKGEGYTPCFVSRPYEKTVFLRYMGVLSGMCFIVSIVELCVILSRKAWKKRKASVKRKQTFMDMAPLTEKQSGRYSNPYYPPSNPPGPYGDRRQLYSGLAVPIRISSRQDNLKDKKGSVESLTASVKTPPTKTAST